METPARNFVSTTVSDLTHSFKYDLTCHAAPWPPWCYSKIPRKKVCLLIVSTCVISCNIILIIPIDTRHIFSIDHISVLTKTGVACWHSRVQQIQLMILNFTVQRVGKGNLHGTCGTVSGWLLHLVIFVVFRIFDAEHMLVSAPCLFTESVARHCDNTKHNLRKTSKRRRGKTCSSDQGLGKFLVESTRCFFLNRDFASTWMKERGPIWKWTCQFYSGNSSRIIG